MLKRQDQIVFVLGKPFEPSLIFVTKSGTCPNGGLSGAHLGQAPDLLANISQGRNKMQMTISPAYFAPFSHESVNVLYSSPILQTNRLVYVPVKPIMLVGKVRALPSALF
jgi:hypothetical protein